MFRGIRIYWRTTCGQLLPNTFHQRTSSSRTTMRQFTGQGTVEYMLRYKIKSLSWPCSTISRYIIIENIWLRLKNALHRNIDAITSVDELKAAITTAWMNVPNSYIHLLYTFLFNNSSVLKYLPLIGE